jgi:hypothetical protein
VVSMHRSRVDALLEDAGAPIRQFVCLFAEVQVQAAAPGASGGFLLARSVPPPTHWKP